jgi:hypothetical protein
MLPHTRRALFLAIALPLIAAWAADAPAQWLPEPAEWMMGDAAIAGAAAWNAVPAIGTPAVEPVRVDGNRVAITTLGATAGFAAGAVVGVVGVPGVLSVWASEAVPPSYPGDGYVLESHDIAAGVIAAVGGLAVATIGAPLGAHLANGRRGNPWLGVLGSAAATGTTAWLLTRGSGGPEVLVIVPLVSIGSATAIELLTTR